MMALWFMICAVLNAWAADRNFKRGSPVAATLCVLVGLACFVMWTRELVA